MSFEAKYPGVCSACEERINVGDEVAWAYGEDNEHVVIHDECHALPERKAAVVCTTCFIEKPCTCDDEERAV